jgi:hypothetical protein
MEEEDWNHVLACGSLDATMTWNGQMSMEPWKMPPDFWMAIEKEIQHYTRNVSEKNKGGTSPFPGTFNPPPQPSETTTHTSG